MSASPDRCDLCGSGLGGYPYMINIGGRVHTFCCQACADIYQERSHIQATRPRAQTYREF
ncbi:MAG: TRASH domain-containing protein [Thaumarchaeota archaeon]|nr:TRASH domain-containing protein [Nitrososphaerota archaeon]